MDDELHYLELLEVGRLIKERQLSPVELTEAVLKRVEDLDGTVRSYAHPAPELAREQAVRAERECMQGQLRSPLHGVPIAVKDVIDVAGLPTEAGMPLRAGQRAATDATVTRRLADAGAVILGKLALTEGAYAEYRSPRLPPVNPWHPAHWSGASSSGTGVAVAAGLAYAGLGTDTGASIRLPAAVNGVTGIRPTWGRVSRAGVVELAATLDQVGPMARSARDAAALLQVIAGLDAADPTTSREPVASMLAAAERPVTGLRVGIDRSYALADVDEPTERAVTEALQTFTSLGVTTVELDFPDPGQIVDDWFGVCAVQTALAHADTYPARRDEYGPALAELLERGHAMTGTQYQAMLLRRAEFRGRVESVLAGVDAMITPVLAFTTPTVQRMARMDTTLISGVHRFTCPVPMAGIPSITLPAGMSGSLPVAVQLIARPFAEDMLISLGHAFQQYTDWHHQHPSI